MPALLKPNTPPEVSRDKRPDRPGARPRPRGAVAERRPGRRRLWREPKLLVVASFIRPVSASGFFGPAPLMARGRAGRLVRRRLSAPDPLGVGGDTMITNAQDARQAGHAGPGRANAPRTAPRPMPHCGRRSLSELSAVLSAFCWRCWPTGQSAGGRCTVFFVGGRGGARHDGRRQ